MKWIVIKGFMCSSNNLKPQLSALTTFHLCSALVMESVFWIEPYEKSAMIESSMGCIKREMNFINLCTL